ncbi:MAG: hypothetical protein ABR499_08085 [Gemmatimonadaceae bacterium]
MLEKPLAELRQPSLVPVRRVPDARQQVDHLEDAGLDAGVGVSPGDDEANVHAQ